MSAVTKTKLKQIQKHIKAEEWEDAVDLAKEVLKEEKGQGQSVYTALVFAGLALSKLEKPEEAEKVLLQATKLFPEQALAYQGLTKLYTDGEDWEKLQGLIKDQVVQAVEKQDPEETSKQLQRLIDLCTAHSSEAVLDGVLALLLPSSPIYNILLQLPQPSATSTTDGQTSTSSGYTPFPIPEFPSPPTLSDLPLSSAVPISETNPSLPTPLPSISQIVHHADTSLALLITLTVREEIREGTLEEKEVEKRRKRLGAGGEKEVRRGVGRDVLSQSKLVGYYEEIQAHPASEDEVRRNAEGKGFRYWYRLMHCLSRSPGVVDENGKGMKDRPQYPHDIFLPVPARPLPTKQEARIKVEEMANGMVLLGIEDEGAWNVALEWKDAGGLDAYELSFLHNYLNLFPLSSTSSLITGYLRYFGLPEPGEEQRKLAAKRKRREIERRAKKGKKAGPAAVEGEDDINARRDPFTLLVDTLESLPKSVFAHKVVGEAYTREEDWGAVITTAERGKDVVRGMEVEIGFKMPASRAVFDVLLGTALVHYYPPKHHPRALQLLDGVLKLDPDAVPCLMGRGYIYLYEARYQEAREEFARVVDIEEVNRAGTEYAMGKVEQQAREEVGWCLIKGGELESGQEIIKGVLEVLEGAADRALDVARCLWRIGQAEWEMGGATHRDQAHEYWVQCLRAQDTYAPAFTSIGIWYLDHATPPDVERASKCFQKAFELDATEAEAARRLAEGYAMETEWALVDVIAKRVMAGEGGIEGGLSGKEHAGVAQKFLPTNAWAWKAAGAVQMAYKKYNEASQSFQVALRAADQDVHLWTRLGEAYAKSGRHVAALKALGEALRLDPTVWMCHYHIGNVQRDMGMFDEAIASYSLVLEQRDEAGVVMALGEAYLALGGQAAESGLRQRAFQANLDSLKQMAKIIQQRGYRLSAWRVFGNACVKAFTCMVEGDPTDEIFAVVQPTLQYLLETDEQHASDVVGVVKLKQLLMGNWQPIDVLKTGICAFAYRSSLLKFDTRIPEPPLYDLAVSIYELANAIENDPSRKSESEACTRASVLYIKQALETDPGAPALWNTFGVVSARGSKQLSQHAFIVALELEPRNSGTWCNLGYLALSSQDLDMARQCFEKGQILEPENALAWTGLALVAHGQYKSKEAEAWFDQAVVLSGGSVLSASLGLAHLSFSPFLRPSAASLSTISLHTPAFSLSRYCASHPSDSSALVLLALIQERLGQFESGAVSLEQAVKVLEGLYEVEESPEVADRYAVALLNLGRVKLAQGGMEVAKGLFDDVLGLLMDATDERSISARVQARLGVALAMAGMDESLEKFQEALDDAGNLPNTRSVTKEIIAVYLARALWTMDGGDEEAREMAKSSLLESLSEEGGQHSERGLATTLAVGVVTEDDGIVEAVKGEIEERENTSSAPSLLLDKSLALMALTEGDLPRARSIISKSIRFNPDDAKSWTAIASILGQDSEKWLVESLVDPAHLQVMMDEFKRAGEAAGVKITVPEGEKEKEDEKGDGGEAVKQAQKAVMLEPWERSHWERLALARMDNV